MYDDRCRYTITILSNNKKDNFAIINCMKKRHHKGRHSGKLLDIEVSWENNDYGLRN